MTLTTKKRLFLFFFSMAVIISNSYHTFLYFDYTTIPDAKDYITMAKGEHEVSSIRAHRIIVPYLASLIEKGISPIFNKIWVSRVNGEWPLRMGFLIINTLIMSLTGMFIFLTCRSYGAGYLTSLIGLTAILVSRWTAYASGLPMTDSLYILVLTLVVYSIKEKKFPLMLLAIFIGPFSKESFIFIAPVIIFFAPFKKIKILAWFTVSGLFVFAFRVIIGSRTGSGFVQSIIKNLMHVNNIWPTLQEFFSLHGLGALFSVLGVFSFVLLIGFLGGKAAVRTWICKFSWFEFWLLVSILIHVFLSIQLARMTFLYAPVLAASLALILEKHPYFSFFRKN